MRPNYLLIEVLVAKQHIDQIRVLELSNSRHPISLNFNPSSILLDFITQKYYGH